MLDSKYEIELFHSLWNEVINYIFKNRTTDGSFKTMYLQPYFNHDKGWMKYPINTNFCTASIAINLLHAKNEPKISILLDNASKFLVAHSFRNKLWSFGFTELKYRVPNDSDTTALSSFFLVEMGLNIPNKEILFNQKKNNSFRLWITNEYSRNYSLLDYLSLQNYYRIIKKCDHLKNHLIDLNDNEFAVDCNVLLYLGVEKNQDVVSKIFNQLQHRSLDSIYYTSEIQSIYLLCRLHYYKIINIQSYKEVFEIVINHLNQFLKENFRKGNILNDLYFLISFLIIDSDSCLKNVEINNFIKESFDRKLYKLVEPFYTSNNKLDLNVIKDEPSTFFGSDIYTSSLYIEFLTLYRKKQYGSYYGE